MAFLFDAGIFSVEGLSGEILPGTKLYWYESGTSTPLATYSNEALTTPNTNPVLSDSEGRFPSIWLQDASYKLVMELPNGTQRTRDPIRNPGDGVFVSYTDLASAELGKGADLVGFSVFEGTLPENGEVPFEQSFTFADGPTEFTLDQIVTGSLWVFLNGSRLAASDFSVDSDVLTLVTPLVDGDTLEVADFIFGEYTGTPPDPIEPSTVSAELKRWVWLEMYGGKADYNTTSHTYVTDNLTAINRAIAALGGKGGAILCGTGNFGFSAGFTLPNGVTLESRSQNVGSFDPSMMLPVGTNLWLPGGSTGITLNNTCTLSKINIFRQGVSYGEGSSQFPEWTGTAVTINDNTNDQLLEHMFIGGFEWACRPKTITTSYSGPDAAVYGRTNTNLVSYDCLNGIWVHNSADISRLVDTHGWPFFTVRSPGEADSAQLKRPGWAILLTGLNDHTMMERPFNYGFTKSFHVIDGDNTTWACGDADYPFQSTRDGSFGYQSSGAAQETRWIACQAVQRDSGFITNSTEPDLLSTEAIAPQAWECRVNGHAVTLGHAKINGGTTRSSVAGSIGIETGNDPSVSCEYAMHHFANLAHATTNGTPLIPLRDCGGNTYENIAAGSLHVNRYQPEIASASGITINGTDLYYVVTGTTSIGTITTHLDHVGKVLSLFFTSGATLLVGGNIYTKTGSNTAFAAGQIASLMATSSGWRQI